MGRLEVDRITPQRLACAGLLAALLFLPAARADIVTLNNGKILEGHVTQEGDKVVVEMAQGKVTLNKAQIKSITAKVTLPDEWAVRAAEVDNAAKAGKLAPDVEANKWYELAVWAEEQKLPHARGEALKKALAANPEHAAARRLAGFVRHDDRWVSRAERNRALGLVLMEGRWVAKEAVEDLAKLRQNNASQR